MTATHPMLVLDVDGVLLNWVEGFGAFAASKGHPIGCHHSEIPDWDLNVFLPGVSKEVKHALYGEFNLHEGFARLNPYEGAIEAIAAFRRDFPEFGVSVATSAGLSPLVEAGRRRNLEAFGIEDITVLDLGACKKDHFATLPEGSIVVDDLMSHVVSAEECGHSGVLFRRSYNIAEEHPRVLTSWADAHELLSTVAEASMSAFTRRSVRPAA